MPTLDYSVVDVFTTEPLGGNPLAVVMNRCGLTTEQMQAIAREFNLSETTFIERRAEATERAEGVRVRIFTTQEELNFAGHPTLGTASVLKMIAPETVQHDTVILAENVGPIPVRFEQGVEDVHDGIIKGRQCRTPPLWSESTIKRNFTLLWKRVALSIGSVNNIRRKNFSTARSSGRRCRVLARSRKSSSAALQHTRRPQARPRI